MKKLFSFVTVLAVALATAGTGVHLAKAADEAPLADLAIENTVDNLTPIPGATVNFTVTASALGPSASTGVSVTDLLPAGLSFVSATPSVGSYDATTGIWTVGDIASGTSATLGIAATVAPTGFVGAVIHLSAGGTQTSTLPDPNPLNNSSWVNITVTPSSDLSLMNTVNNAAPAPDDTVDYTETVANMGPSDTTGVFVTFITPTGLAFKSAAATQGTYMHIGGRFLREGWAVGSLKAGASATLNVTETVKANPGTVILNAVTVNATGSVDPNTANNTASVSLMVSGNSKTLTPPIKVVGTATESSVSLSWSAATGGVPPITYYVVRNGVPVVGTTATTYDDTGLNAGTVYTYVIDATDTALPKANTSSSLAFSISTLGGTQNPDTTPPVVSITSPANNSTANGTVTVLVSATDNVGVTKVVLLAGSTQLDTASTSSPYSFKLVPAGKQNTAITLVAKAYDAAGNVGTSNPVTITINPNSGGGNTLDGDGDTDNDHDGSSSNNGYNNGYNNHYNNGYNNGYNNNYNNGYNNHYNNGYNNGYIKPWN